MPLEDEETDASKRRRRQKKKKKYSCFDSLQMLRRSDDSLTLLFQRRRLLEKDAETQKVIDNARGVDRKIREKQRSSSSSRSSGSSRSSSRSSESKSTKSSKHTDSDEEDMKKDYSDGSEDEVLSAVEANPTAEPCDHRGVPLSHPMAITPFPGARPAAERAKARLMLKELAIRVRQEQEAKERAIAMEKELEKYEKKSKESAEKSSSSSSKSSKSSKTSSKASRSSKKNRCTSCGTCQKCAQKCMEKHFKITDKEREQFFKGINKLRKKLVKPESSREYPTKSPYDVTQSSSEATVRDMSKKKDKKKKKSAKKYKN